MGEGTKDPVDLLINVLADLLRAETSKVAYSAGLHTGLEYFQMVRTTTTKLANRDPFGTQYFWQGMLHAWVLEYATAVANDKAPGKVFAHLLKQAEESAGGDVSDLVDMVRRLAIATKASEPTP